MHKFAVSIHPHQAFCLKRSVNRREIIVGKCVDLFFLAETSHRVLLRGVRLLCVLATTPGKVVEVESECWRGSGPIDANEGVGLQRGEDVGRGLEGRRERRREGRR